MTATAPAIAKAHTARLDSLAKELKAGDTRAFVLLNLAHAIAAVVGEEPDQFADRVSLDVEADARSILALAETLKEKASRLADWIAQMSVQAEELAQQQKEG